MELALGTLLFAQMTRPEPIQFESVGDKISGVFFIPASSYPLPVLIICHGAGEFKENYFEFCESLATRGVAALAIDMHGHGASGGERFYVKIQQWAADVSAAIDFLLTRPEIAKNRIGAFGLSSGGTAILEAALIDPRLNALIALDATVRNSLPLPLTVFLKSLVWIGQIQKYLTGRDLRVPLAKLSKPNLAADPEIQKKLLSNPRALEAFMDFPFPNGAEAFFVNTLDRVSRIKVPTLVLWGEEDKLDPPLTARMLYAELTCKKELQIIPGNGHVGHLDRNKAKVFALTADWALKNLDAAAILNSSPNFPMTIEGPAAKSLGQKEKWEMLSPTLTRYGRESLAYPTLQSGMEYFIDESGYIAYVTVQHPVFSRQPKQIAFSDPVCAEKDYPKIIRNFLSKHPRGVFGCISEKCAETLRELKFKVNCIGYEVELPIQTYNTKGNWKDLDMIKRARNEAKREGIIIREEIIENVNQQELAVISKTWIGNKRVNDREIWIYARRAVMETESDVRKFVAYDREGHIVGFAFYDPMYRDGKVFGYAANILRCDEQRFGRLVTSIHMEAMEKFKLEGKETLNLALAPFVRLDSGKFNDDWGSKKFFELSAKYGNSIYNFTGLAFHKSKYRGNEKFLYFASSSLWPTNDIYLAFLSAKITQNYFDTLRRLLWSMATFRDARKPVSTNQHS